MLSNYMETVRKNILFGILVFIILWTINTLVAFIIFTPTRQDTQIILFSWLIIDGLILFFIRKKIKKQFLLGISFMFIVLIALYFIPITQDIPQDVLKLNSEISGMNSNKMIYAKELFFVVESKWNSPIREYLRKPNRVFLMKNFETIWNTEGYIDSNVQTQVYRNLLLESNRFTKEDLVLIQGFCTNSPHAYINFKGTQHYADLWAVDNFDDYSFGQVTFSPCDTLSGKII